MTAQAKRDKRNGRYIPGAHRRMPTRPDHLPPRLVSELINCDEAPAPRQPEPEPAEPIPDRVIQALAGVAVGLIVVALSILLGDWLS